MKQRPERDDYGPAIVPDYVAHPATGATGQRAKPSARPTQQRKGVVARLQFGKGGEGRRQKRGAGAAAQQPPGKRTRGGGGVPSSSFSRSTFDDPSCPPGHICLFCNPAHNPPLDCTLPNCRFSHVDTRLKEGMAAYSRAWAVESKKRPMNATPPPAPSAAGRGDGRDGR